MRNIYRTSNSWLITRRGIQINARYAIAFCIEKVIYIHIHSWIHFQSRLQRYLIYLVRVIVVVFRYWTSYFIFVHSLLILLCGCVEGLLLISSEISAVVIKRTRWKRIIMLVRTGLFFWDEFWHEWCCTVLLVLGAGAEPLLLALVLYCLWVPSGEIVWWRLFLQLDSSFVMSFCSEWLSVQPTAGIYVFWAAVFHRLDILPVSWVIDKLNSWSHIILYPWRFLSRLYIFCFFLKFDKWFLSNICHGILRGLHSSQLNSWVWGWIFASCAFAEAWVAVVSSIVVIIIFVNCTTSHWYLWKLWYLLWCTWSNLTMWTCMRIDLWWWQQTIAAISWWIVLATN